MTAIHRHRYALVLVAAILIFGWLGLTRHLGAGRDDVFITLYAGQALAAGQGIVNHNGDRVEMSSSLFHTFIIAAVDLAAPDYIFTINKILGGVGSALTLVLLFLGRGVLFSAGRFRFLAFTTTLLLIVTNPSFLYWSFGGLETPFAGFFLACYAVSLMHHRLRATPIAEVGLIGSQCLYMLTRPEGFFLLLFSMVYLTFMKFLGRRAMRLRIVLIPLAFLAGITAFRWIYFGALLPNTVYAKSGGLIEGALSGLVYFRHFYDAGLLLWWALAVQLILLITYSRLFFVAARAYPKRTPVPLAGIFLFGLVVAAQLVVLLAGGDWMEHFRFLAPIIPLLTALTIATVARGIQAFSRAARAPRTAAAVLLAFTAGALALNVRQSGLNVPRPLPRENVSVALRYDVFDLLSAGEGIDTALMRTNGDHNRDLELLMPFIRDDLPGLHERSGGLVVATGQMGFFPYWIKRMYPDYQIEFVDTLGLCDRTVAHMPLNKDHTGVADGRYVDEVLDGQVPLLSNYLNSRSPNLVYFLGYDPAVEQRLQTYARHGFLPVWKKVGAIVLYKERDNT